MSEKECSNTECEFEGSKDKQWIIPKNDIAYSLSIREPDETDFVMFCSFDCADILSEYR